MASYMIVDDDRCWAAVGKAIKPMQLAIRFNKECVAHCRWQVGERLAKQPTPTSRAAGRAYVKLPARCAGMTDRSEHSFLGTWRQATLPARRWTTEQSMAYRMAKIATA